MQKGHPISSLPIDQYPVSDEEQQVLTMLLKKQYTTMEMLISGSKEVLLLGGLFALINTPQADELIRRYIPASNSSEYSLLFFKTLIFIVVAFVAKNIHLVQKQ